MKPRERNLLIAFLGVFGTFVIIPGIWGLVRGPVQQLQTTLTEEQEKFRKSQDAFGISRARVLRMVEYKEQSLSSNASQGALAYQQWLYDLAEIVSGFSKPEVAPDRISAARDRSHVSVRMRVNGEGTIDQLRTFLYRFYRAGVLHRVASLTAEAQPGSSRLTIRITTEAISLRDAAEKGPTLFPRSEIASPSDGKLPRITVNSVEGFPKEAPFEIRLGDLYCQVVEMNGATWTLDIPEGRKLAARAGDTVELSPVHPGFADIQPSDFDRLVELNPFAKPAPYQPRLDLIGEKTVQRGATIELTARASGFRQESGATEYQIVSEPVPGLSLEGDRLKWTPPADLKPGDQQVRVKATADGLREPLEATITLTLKEVNAAPELTVPKDLVATLGQPLKFQVTASDRETPADQLRFSLGDGRPEGMTINEQTGEVTWTPAPTSQPGPTSVPIQVKDAGDTPQTTTVTASITVNDDRAQFTYLTSSIAVDGERQAWLYDRSTNKRMILKKGGALKYAGFDAQVTDIENDFVQLQEKDKTWQLDVGRSLRQARLIAQAEPAATSGSGEPSEVPATRNPAAAATDEPATAGPTAVTESKPAPPATPEESVPAKTTATPAAGPAEPTASPAVKPEPTEAPAAKPEAVPASEPKAEPAAKPEPADAPST